MVERQGSEAREFLTSCAWSGRRERNRQGLGPSGRTHGVENLDPCWEEAGGWEGRRGRGTLQSSQGFCHRLSSTMRPPPAPPCEPGALGWTLLQLLGLDGVLTLSSGRATPPTMVKPWRLRNRVVVEGGSLIGCKVGGRGQSGMVAGEQSGECPPQQVASCTLRNISPTSIMTGAWPQVQRGAGAGGKGTRSGITASGLDPVSEWRKSASFCYSARPPPAKDVGKHVRSSL